MKDAELAKTNEEKIRIEKALKRRDEAKRRETKEQIEEFRFRKEMDHQKEKMIENMEKNKKMERAASRG